MSEHLTAESTDQDLYRGEINSLRTLLRQTEKIEELTEGIHERYWNRLYRMLPKASVQASKDHKQSASDHSSVVSTAGLSKPNQQIESLDPP